MGACGTAHFWARRAQEAGHQASIIPAQYVGSYRRRGKTDRLDTEALLESHRCAGIIPVPVRSVDQQQIQQLHRIREQWKQTRLQRINGLRGFLRELGYPIPVVVKSVRQRVIRILDEEDIPPTLKSMFAAVLSEIATLEASMNDVEPELKELTRFNDDVLLLQQVSGTGPAHQYCDGCSCWTTASILQWTKNGKLAGFDTPRIELWKQAPSRADNQTRALVH